LTLASLGATEAGNAALSDILVTVFILPASIEELERRLKRRGTDDESTIQRRLAAVRQEMLRWTEYDYVLVSGALSNDLRRLEGIIAAERMRTKRLAIFVERGSA
jgi:guanylate kinase